MAGEGSIYRRQSDGRWVATISRGPRGNRQVVTKYRRTRSEAAEALAELRSLVGPLNGRTLTVGAYLERWVRDARDIRPNTRHGYRSVVDTHLVPVLGAVRLGELSPLHVESLLSRLSPTMAPKTLRNILVVLRRALGQAVRADFADMQLVDQCGTRERLCPDATAPSCPDNRRLDLPHKLLNPAFTGPENASGLSRDANRLL